MNFNEIIHKCEKCNLHKNQKPLLDVAKKCKVMWVGLSAKKIKENDATDYIPLSPSTNTGKLIKEIEDMCPYVTTYKTNLVKCLPLNENKLRYPSIREMELCFSNILIELKNISPQLVFLLGKQVQSAFEKHLNIKFQQNMNDFLYEIKYINGINYISIHHPSYICVYKKSHRKIYINSVKNIIESFS